MELCALNRYNMENKKIKSENVSLNVAALKFLDKENLETIKILNYEGCSNITGTKPLTAHVLA